MNAPMAETAVVPRVAEKLLAGHPNEEHTTTPAVPERNVSEVPLRVKGFLAFAAVVIYAVLLTTFTFNKKAELVDEFERLRNRGVSKSQQRNVSACNGIRQRLPRCCSD